LIFYCSGAPQVKW